MPLIGEVIDKLKEVKYFNKLDLIWGYNNVQIKEGDKWKAAFLTNKRLFEPQVMYFGLCNLPETFQRMMNSIFQKLLHEGVLDLKSLKRKLRVNRSSLYQEEKENSEWKQMHQYM